MTCAFLCFICFIHICFTVKYLVKNQIFSVNRTESIRQIYIKYFTTKIWVKHLGVVWMSEFWVIWLCFHHSSSKICGTHEKFFVWTPSLCFGHPVLVILSLKKLSDEYQKWKHIFLVFKTHHPWLSGSFVISCLSGAHSTSDLSHLSNRWSLLPCYSAFARKIFPKKFPSSHFPLIFTSFSPAR